MFSKKIILFLMVVVLLTLLGIPSARAFAGGDGSSGNPYQITNSVELQEMKNNPNACYILINDIDCSDTVNWNSGAGFEPIYWFTGTFDGQGYKISDLFIYRDFALGLFGRIESGAIIKNVGLEDVSITGTCTPWGGSNYIGGLVGFNFGGTIENSYVTGSVSGDLRIGGLVGENRIGSITNSYSTASVFGEEYQYGWLLSGYQVGGLAGSNYGSITNCYATGSVTGNWGLGGLVGSNKGGTWDGITTPGDITNCYATGMVTGKRYPESVGGLAGSNEFGTITNSYWDIEISGQSMSGGGIGKTTVEMKTQSTYTNWDFANVWAIKEGVSYPYLQWQIPYTIGGLLKVINTLPNNVLSDEIRNSLTSKVNNALKSLNKGNDKAAINTLNAFINQVEAQRGKKISEEVANMLIAYANNVISKIRT